MTATVEEVQDNLPHWLTLVGQGTEVIVMRDGLAVARISGVSGARRRTPADHSRWLARLDEFRELHTAGVPRLNLGQTLEEDRSERGS